MTVLCHSPKVHLVDAICYARMMCDKHPTREFSDMVLAARAEHAFAEMCGPASLTDCLAQQRLSFATLHDFVYENRSGSPKRLVDVKAKWEVDDNNLSDHNHPGIDYVFLHPFCRQVSCLDNVDLVFAVAGWTSGAPNGNFQPAKGRFGGASWVCPQPRSILDGFF